MSDVLPRLCEEKKKKKSPPLVLLMIPAESEQKKRGRLCLRGSLLCKDVRARAFSQDSRRCLLSGGELAESRRTEDEEGGEGLGTRPASALAIAHTAI